MNILQIDTAEWTAETAEHLLELSCDPSKNAANMLLLAFGLAETPRYRKLEPRAAASLYLHEAC